MDTVDKMKFSEQLTGLQLDVLDHVKQIKARVTRKLILELIKEKLEDYESLKEVLVLTGPFITWFYRDVKCRLKSWGNRKTGVCKHHQTFIMQGRLWKQPALVVEIRESSRKPECVLQHRGTSTLRKNFQSLKSFFMNCFEVYKFYLHSRLEPGVKKRQSWKWFAMAKKWEDLVKLSKR